MTIFSAYQARIDAGTLKPDSAQFEAIHHLERVRAELAAAPAPAKRGLFRRAGPPPLVRGLYLWGGVGRGKSMLMDLALEHIHVPKRRMHFHAFMQWVHDRMDAARRRGVPDAIKPVADELAAEIRFLAFDEMQITDVADAMIVGRLFEGLFAQGVCVVTTSNRPPDDLYKNGLNRQVFLPFIDQIKHHLHVHELVSDTDYRQTVLAGNQSYFSPVTPQSRAQIDAIWHSLTGACAEPLILRVKGRDVQLSAFRDGVARAGFYDLCGKMLGPGDYLAIADAVRVLILEDVPTLGRSNFNEAKRFVTLIDALYEARVKLICSAAAKPEHLYMEGEGAFEFERTASRLHEMQGADWGVTAPE